MLTTTGEENLGEKQQMLHIGGIVGPYAKRHGGRCDFVYVGSANLFSPLGVVHSEREGNKRSWVRPHVSTRTLAMNTRLGTCGPQDGRDRKPHLRHVVHNRRV